MSVETILFLIVGILISMAVHEAVHAWVGYKLGDDTAEQEGRLSLNPLRHIDPVMTVALPIVTILLFQAPILAAKPVPFNPERVRGGDFGAALIAVAGPLSNLLLAIIASILTFVMVPGNLLVAQFMTTFIYLNVSLFVFNMVPIPPLDGSRVLYAFAPDAVRRVMASMEQFGLFIVFGLILLGFGSVIGRWVDAVVRYLPFSNFL